MENTDKSSGKTNLAVMSLWWTWILGAGSVGLLILLGLWISPKWLPMAAFIEAFVLFGFVRYNRDVTMPGCYVVPHLAVRTLFLSGVVMLIINILFVHGFITFINAPETFNHQIPFVPSIVVLTSAFYYAVIAIIRRERLTFCRDCVRRYGMAAERGFVGMIYKGEGSFQVRMFFWLTAGLGVVNWVYYYLFYINVNINSPDKFFFVTLPVTFIILSIIYMGIRYSSIIGYYTQSMADGVKNVAPVTTERFLMMCGDYMYLSPVDPDEPHPVLDTPATCQHRFVAKPGMEQVREDFRSVTGISEGVNLKYIYTSTDGNSDGNIVHFAALLSDRNILHGSALPQGTWLRIYDIKRLAESRSIAPVLTAEIYRIYTIAMAWKTYDLRGRRRYKIKNYNPVFRLSDFPQWDVDFDDSRWLFISSNNEDKPFFCLKRFWRKINGIEA